MPLKGPFQNTPNGQPPEEKRGHGIARNVCDASFGPGGCLGQCIAPLDLTAPTLPRRCHFFVWLFGKLTPGPKKHSFSIIFPSLSLKRSVFRNNLPSLVQPL